MANIDPCIAREDDALRIAANGYVVGTDQAYLIADGYTRAEVPPAQPTNLAYDATTGDLTCSPQPDAYQYKFYGNDKNDLSASGRMRNRLVGTVAASKTGLTPNTPTINDGVLDAAEWRTYMVVALDNLPTTAAVQVSPPSKNIISIGVNRRGI